MILYKIYKSLILLSRRKRLDKAYADIQKAQKRLDKIKAKNRSGKIRNPFKLPSRAERDAKKILKELKLQKEIKYLNEVALPEALKRLDQSNRKVEASPENRIKTNEQLLEQKYGGKSVPKHGGSKEILNKRPSVSREIKEIQKLYLNE